MSEKSIKRIAVLGATGHVAKNLIMGMCNELRFQLTLFARSLDKLASFLLDNNIQNHVTIESFDQFCNLDFDVIVNCVGIGDPGKLSEDLSSIFKLTESYDNLILGYLDKHPKSLYINFSSGAAYLNDFEEHASESMRTKININQITTADYYGICKLNAEAKHRSFADFNIVDLRIFGFFSRYIDLHSNFFLSEIIRCLEADKKLITNSLNIVRDYVNPLDLLSLVDLIINRHNINDVFDVFSSEPTTKFAILEYFSTNFGLQYEILDKPSISSTTGSKFNYFSTNDRATSCMGYLPKYDSLETIIEEYRSIGIHYRG